MSSLYFKCNPLCKYICHLCMVKCMAEKYIAKNHLCLCVSFMFVIFKYGVCYLTGRSNMKHNLWNTELFSTATWRTSWGIDLTVAEMFRYILQFGEVLSCFMGTGCWLTLYSDPELFMCMSVSHGEQNGICKKKKSAFPTEINYIQDNSHTKEKFKCGDVMQQPTIYINDRDEVSLQFYFVNINK